MSEINQNTSFSYSRFSEYCFHKDELPPGTRHTVEVLLDIAGTDDYEEAEKVLLSETELFLYKNKITDLSPFVTLQNLNNLSLPMNKITDITPLSKLLNLKELDLGDNQITDITPLSKLINLKELDLSDNQITDITPLSNLINLQKLYLYCNKIIDITTLSSLINLQWLQLSKNQITDIKPLNKLINLQGLHLYSNQITDITPLGNLINLETLYLSTNKIVDINPLKSLINLQDLEIGENKISDITPLISLKSIEDLDLKKNTIYDLKLLRDLHNLFFLNISDNQIADINEFKFFKNIHLIISGNPIDGLNLPTHLLNKSRKISSVNLNHKKSREAIFKFYSCIGLNPPKIIFANNYEVWFREMVSYLELKKKKLQASKIKGVPIYQKYFELLKIKEAIRNITINLLDDLYSTIESKAIEEMAEKKLFSSIFIQQAIEPLLEKVQSIGFNIFYQSNFLKNKKAKHYIYNLITSQYIIQQIYLIEIYQSLLNVTLDEQTLQWYDCLSQLLEHCGWFIPFENVCIVCDRPNKFSLDSESRLHGEGEPAIKFSDGYGLYFHHGVTLSKT